MFEAGTILCKRAHMRHVQRLSGWVFVEAVVIPSLGVGKHVQDVRSPQALVSCNLRGPKHHAQWKRAHASHVCRVLWVLEGAEWVSALDTGGSGKPICTASGGAEEGAKAIMMTTWNC